MISTAIWNKLTTKCTHPTGSWNFYWSLKNSLMLIYSKLHSKSCDYLYFFYFSFLFFFLLLLLLLYYYYYFICAWPNWKHFKYIFPLIAFLLICKNPHNFLHWPGFANTPNLAYFTPTLFRWLHRGYGGSHFDFRNFRLHTGSHFDSRNFR